MKQIMILVDELKLLFDIVGKVIEIFALKLPDARNDLEQLIVELLLLGPL